MRNFPDSSICSARLISPSQIDGQDGYYADCPSPLAPREPFNPPPDADNKFLGYFTSSDQRTTCGNCHVNHQADWVCAAHASAYADLTASSSVTTECYTCHTVSDRGNPGKAWASTRHADIQSTTDGCMAGGGTSRGVDRQHA